MRHFLIGEDDPTRQSDTMGLAPHFDELSLSRVGENENGIYTRIKKTPHHHRASVRVTTHWRMGLTEC